MYIYTRGQEAVRWVSTSAVLQLGHSTYTASNAVHALLRGMHCIGLLSRAKLHVLTSAHSVR